MTRIGTRGHSKVLEPIRLSSAIPGPIRPVRRPSDPTASPRTGRSGRVGRGDGRRVAGSGRVGGDGRERRARRSGPAVGPIAGRGEAARTARPDRSLGPAGDAARGGPRIEGSRVAVGGVLRGRNREAANEGCCFRQGGNGLGGGGSGRVGMPRLPYVAASFLADRSRRGGASAQYRYPPVESLPEGRSTGDDGPGPPRRARAPPGMSPVVDARPCRPAAPSWESIAMLMTGLSGQRDLLPGAEGITTRGTSWWATASTRSGWSAGSPAG